MKVHDVLDMTTYRQRPKEEVQRRLREFNDDEQRWQDGAQAKFGFTADEKAAIEKCIDKLLVVSTQGKCLLMLQVLHMTPAQFRDFALAKARCVGGDAKAPLLTSYIAFSLRKL